MACFGEYWIEFQELSEIATPSIITNVLEVMMVVEDVAMLGRLGRGHIASLAVGNAVFNLVWYFIEGFFTAHDTLGSIAFAQHDLHAVRYWTYASLGCVLTLCTIATVLFILFTNMLLEDAFFISPHVRSKAVLHVYMLMPSMWFLGLFRVLQKYLACQNIMKPTARALLLGNVCNIGLNFVLIFGFGFGFSGCALSTSISRLVMLLYLYKQVRSIRGFAHMKVELKALVRYTPAQSVGQHLTIVEDTLYGNRAVRIVGRVRRTAAMALEHLGTQLHIAPLAKWAKRWGQGQDRHEEEELEMESLIGGDEESQTHNRKPVAKFRRNGRVVPISFNEETLVTAASKGAAKAKEDSNKEGGGAKSYLDDVNMDDNSYASKYGVRSPKPVKHASNIGSSEKNTSASDDGNRDEEEDVNSENEDDDDDYTEDGTVATMGTEELENARRVARGPKMLMLIRTLRFIAIGLPGGLVCGLETWVFSIMALLLQRIGTVPMVASVVGMVLLETVYLAVPFALQVACTLRISQLLAAKRPDRASVCCTVSMVTGAAFVGFMGLLTFYLPGLIGHIFTTDEDVIHRLKQLAPYLAGYQALWGIAGLSQSVLRAQARQIEVVFFMFICMWLIGVPLGWWWGFWVRPTHGLYGYWAGPLVGLGLLTLIVVCMVLTTDWHYASRVVMYRASQEREGFDEPSTANMWMSKAIGMSNAVYSPVGHIEIPQVGRQSVGSRATGGFGLGASTLEEVMDEVEKIELDLSDLSDDGKDDEETGDEGMDKEKD